MEIPEKMKAANIEEQGKISITEKEVPEPGPEQVLLRVEACGICGTDVKVRDQGLNAQPEFGEPLTPGHEYAGTVVKVGETVDEYEVGDRVAQEVHKGCDRCENCKDGKYTACLNFGNKEKGHMAPGMTTDGGFAEYAVNHINTLYKLPDNVGFDQATLVTTAGCTLYALDVMGGYIAGDTVAVVGPGPIGLSLVNCAKALGAENVILSGTRESRLEKGKKMGADHVVNIREGEDLTEKVMEVTDGKGADSVYEAAGAKNSLETCLDSVKPGGDVVIIAFYKKPIKVDMSKAVKRNVDMYTVRGEGRRNVGRALSLQGTGKLDLDPLITHTFPLDELNKGFEYFEGRIEDAMKVIIHPHE